MKPPMFIDGGFTEISALRASPELTALCPLCAESYIICLARTAPSCSLDEHHGFLRGSTERWTRSSHDGMVCALGLLSGSWRFCFS